MTGTTYVHADPHRDLNLYWVSACDAGGCSFIYGDTYALFVGEPPSGPANPATSEMGQGRPGLGFLGRGRSLQGVLQSHWGH